MCCAISVPALAQSEGERPLDPAAAAASTDPSSAASEPAAPEAANEKQPASFGARAVVREVRPEAKRLSGEETTRLNHSMGPSFSIVESFPGSVPVFSGVPYVIVRGATPSGTVSYYDGVPFPSLFHLALGPSLFEPYFIGPIEFYPGVAPARYGPRTGAVIIQDGPDQEALRNDTRMLELRMLDTSGFINRKLEDGSFSVAWRYGNPGLILGALGLDATLSYYSYQARYETGLSDRTRLLVSLLGSGDQLGDRGAPEDDIALSSHRFLARLTHRIGSVQFGSQLIVGGDDSTLGHELSGRALRVNPSLYAQWRERTTRLRVGLDVSGALVQLRRGEVQPSATTDTTRDNRITLDPEDFLDDQPFSSVPARSLTAVYAELHIEPLHALQVDVGLRGDVFLAGSSANSALSPSVSARYRLAPWLELHGGIGLAHRPRTSPLPIPGLNDVALDAGVEGALQTDAGAELQFGKELRIDLTAFYHRYSDVVYLELILDCQGNTDPSAAQALLTRQEPDSSICRRSGLPTADGESHGLELFLKRDLTRDLSGFLSYTLAFASATARDGTNFTPQSDVRHLLNAVLSYNLGAGFQFGLRLHMRTGKMAVNTIYDLASERFTRVEYRLPGFVRADAYASYGWRTSFGRMEASVGIQNFTFSREAINRDCFAMNREVQCKVDYQPYIVLPNAGLRAEF
jgi:hypothetical protein